MAMDLRPLSLGELLDRSFSLYRRHFWFFVGIMAVPSVVALVLSLAMAFVSGPQGVTPTEADVDPAEVIGTIIAATVVFVAVLVVYWVTYAVALGATTIGVSEVYLGRQTSIAGAYAPLRGRMGRLAWLLLLIMLRLLAVLVGGVAVALILTAGFGFLLAVATESNAGPGRSAIAALVAGFGAVLAVVSAFGFTFWLALRYAVAVPAVVLEDATAGEAIRRSIHLTRGSRGRVAVLVVFAAIITYAAILLFQAPFVVAALVAGPETTTAFWMNLAGTVSGAIVGALTGPLMIIAMAVLYYDVRIRKEGLDVQLLMASLDAAPHGGSPTTSPLPG